MLLICVSEAHLMLWCVFCPRRNVFDPAVVSCDQHLHGYVACRPEGNNESMWNFMKHTWNSSAHQLEIQWPALDTFKGTLNREGKKLPINQASQTRVSNGKRKTVSASYIRSAHYSNGCLSCPAAVWWDGLIFGSFFLVAPCFSLFTSHCLKNRFTNLCVIFSSFGPLANRQFLQRIGIRTRCYSSTVSFKMSGRASL